VKTTRFGRPVYLGDPINAVKIFNDKEVDELVFLDIDASKLNRTPNFHLLKTITDECFMPLAYGGGIRMIEQVQQLLTIGVEKAIINTACFEDPAFVQKTAKSFGSSTLVGSMDVKRNLFGKKTVYVKGGALNTGVGPVDYARRLEDLGVGEILLNSIDQDGSMKGYDVGLVESVCNAVSIPVVACGGAGVIGDFVQAKRAGASGVAAGSMFVFQGPHKAVLISYPSNKQIEEALGDLS
jgi:cyclase